MIPDNIHTHPTHPKDGHWKLEKENGFGRGGGGQESKIQKEGMKRSWNFQRIGGLYQLQLLCETNVYLLEEPSPKIRRELVLCTKTVQ